MAPSTCAPATTRWADAVQGGVGIYAGAFSGKRSCLPLTSHALLPRIEIGVSTFVPCSVLALAMPQVHGEHTLESVLDVMTRERDTRSQVSMFGSEGKQGAEAAANGA